MEIICNESQKEEIKLEQRTKMNKRKRFFVVFFFQSNTDKKAWDRRGFGSWYRMNRTKKYLEHGNVEEESIEPKRRHLGRI